MANQRRRVVRLSLFAAAAAFIISGVILSLKMIPARPAVLASYRTGPSSELAVSHSEHPREGGRLQKGSHLDLSRGTVEVSFESGVKCVIEAPAKLSIVDGSKVSLEQGVAWFEVPSGVIGFTVETKLFNAVDLGTRFGVVASTEGEQELHVLEGVVELHPRSSLASDSVQTLQANEARKIDSKGQIQTLVPRNRSFLTQLPDKKPTKITAVAVEAASSEFNVQRKAVNLINGAGFDEARGYHANSTGNGINWINKGQGVPSTIGDDPLPTFLTFAFNRRYNLDTLKIWNWNTAITLAAGVEEMEVLVSRSDGAPFRSLGLFSLRPAPGRNDQDFGQLLDLSGFPAADKVKRIQLRILSSHGDRNELAGLSEIRFFGSVLAEKN